jgi:phosphate transport system protein
MIMSRHTSKELERELEALGERLVTMGRRSERQISLVVRAVIDRDDRLADDVIAGDAAVHQDDSEIDQRAMQLLARWQPVARDLRFVTMSLKAVTHLERIGDLAVSCARHAHELNRLPAPDRRLDLEPFVVAVTSALRSVLASLAHADADAAEQVMRQTVEIDRMHGSLLAKLLAHIATKPATIAWMLPLTSVCRYLGHAADHIRGIAEEIIYMVRVERVRQLAA